MVARTNEATMTGEPRFGHDDGRRALIVDGVVQSVMLDAEPDPGDYWHAMLPTARPRRALILGFGAGTVAQLLQQRFGDVPTVGIEHDPRVLSVVQDELQRCVPLLELRLGDAAEFLVGTEERFDYACVDLFSGNAFDRRVLGRPFLRDLRRVIPSGLIAFNLFRDGRTPTAVTRIGRVLRVTGQVTVGKNVVVHTRAS